ncbi:Coupling of ubiquitin conjugation to ER degradation protein 1 [Ceratocystis lukuohia]|uniref:Coupling of ubiquitin conjugation to ER degradation protein 1 n=3 Tax=Ceratocystis TaxID=5157 RepID=A0A0F8BNF5_CERFI|nr:Coupling of ubiquitin conjugation to ER degradation protein 1 [Ceratocystis platani]PHH51949.1 hypothetical protein CFIMG_005748RAa [Ceratocystis fimbriata CBS 114723]
MSNEQISLPTIVTFVAVTALVIWKLFLSPTDAADSSPRNNIRDSAAQAQARETNAQRILQMFPQVDRRAVLWDLRRNGNRIQVTSERILSGRLETPPPTFQPVRPAGQGDATPSSEPSATKAAHRTEEDLISRYKLQDKISVDLASSVPEDSAQAAAVAAAGKSSAKAWSSNKEDRQALLRKRREDMILQARRKMELKLAERQ